MDYNEMNFTHLPSSYMEASAQVIDELFNNKTRKLLLDQEAEFLAKTLQNETNETEKLFELSESEGVLSDIYEKELRKMRNKTNKLQKESRESSKSSKSPKKQKLEKIGKKQKLTKLQENTNDFYDLLGGAVKDARGKLTGLKEISKKIVDKENYELINKAKRSYSNSLQQSIKEEKIRNAKNVMEKHRFLTKFKKITNKIAVGDIETLNFEVLKHQKADYLRKIKKLVFQLEKRKILQEEKVNLEQKQNKTQEAAFMFESIKNAYDDKIKMMKEQLHCMKIERVIEEKAQSQAIRELQKEYKIEKANKIKNLEEYLKKASIE